MFDEKCKTCHHFVIEAWESFEDGDGYCDWNICRYHEDVINKFKKKKLTFEKWWKLEGVEGAKGRSDFMHAKSIWNASQENK